MLKGRFVTRTGASFKCEYVDSALSHAVNVRGSTEALCVVWLFRKNVFLWAAVRARAAWMIDLPCRSSVCADDVRVLCMIVK